MWCSSGDCKAWAGVPVLVQLSNCICMVKCPHCGQVGAQGDCFITVAVPTVWNSLPAHLRSTLISHRQFRDGLKSHLFADAYF